MIRTFNLDLPESTIHRAQEIAQRTGRSFESILAEWIERGSAQEDAMTLLANTQHHLFSPLGGEETAQALYEYLKSRQNSTGT